MLCVRARECFFFFPCFVFSTAPRRAAPRRAAQECVAKAGNACLKLNAKCGCPCPGVRDEARCLPCLVHELKIGDEFCSICYVEALKDAPCVQSGPDPEEEDEKKHSTGSEAKERKQAVCRHTVHYACVVERIKARWPG